MSKSFALTLALLAACAAASARAAIVCVAPTSTTAGSITITAPILFTITTPGRVGEFVLDEWVTNDGIPNNSSLGSRLAYSVNGTANSSYSQFYDNDFIAAALTANDGVFYINPVSQIVQVGDTVTLSAGTYTLAATSGFNPQATQTFNGNVFLAGSYYERLSPNVSAAVPEPSAWTLLGLGAVGASVVALRQRQCAA